MNFYEFRNEETGAVTVDWVVLTAAIVGLGVATYGVVSGGISDLSGDISSFTSEDHINTAFGASGESGGNPFSGYIPINSALHGPSWNPDPDLVWAESTYTGWSDTEAVSDAALMAMYNADYAQASTGNDATRADYIQIQEQIIQDRGLSIPDGNMTADQVRSLYN